MFLGGFLSRIYLFDNTQSFVFQGILRIRARERRQVRRVEEKRRARGQGWSATEWGRKQKATQVEEVGDWEAFK